MFSFYQLRLFKEWSRQNQPEWGFVESYVDSEYRQHNTRLNRIRQEGIEVAPLLTSDLLPDYDNCSSVALFLLPYFDLNPELWKMLPYVKAVDPRADWRSFFAFQQQVADNSYAEALASLVKSLWS